MMQLFLGEAPTFFWWFIAPGVLILLLAIAASLVLRSYARVAAVHGHNKISLAAIQADTGRHKKGKTVETAPLNAGPGSRPG